eukprot:2783164-Pleurochrysis_carterae.AAC.3
MASGWHHLAWHAILCKRTATLVPASAVHRLRLFCCLTLTICVAIGRQLNLIDSIKRLLSCAYRTSMLVEVASEAPIALRRFFGRIWNSSMINALDAPTGKQLILAAAGVDIANCCKSFEARNVCRAQVGAYQRSTLIEGYMGHPPPRPDRMYPIGSYVLRGAGYHDSGDHVQYGASRHIWMWKLEIMIYVGLHAWDYVIVASLYYRSGRILMYGWTIPYKWGHPVATLPVTNKTIRHIRRITGILRITDLIICEPT